MTRIIIHGINGRMGNALYNLINEREDCEVVAGVDIKATLPISTFDSLLQVNVTADVVIDFSNSCTVSKLLKDCTKKNMPCVICTTGFTAEQQNEIVKASQYIPIFQSGNMSLGINLLIELAKKASSILGSDFDIEIIEKHHHNKLDAPSGTALMIADDINKSCDMCYNYAYDRHLLREKRKKHEIGIHAVRGGGIVGEHDVLFCGLNETITISHSATSREVFASGAINAALFLKNKKSGMYNMKDLIK